MAVVLKHLLVHSEKKRKIVGLFHCPSTKLETRNDSSNAKKSDQIIVSCKVV